MYTGDKECVHIYQTEDNTTLYKVAALITWYGLDEFPDSCYDATLGISSTKDISEPIGTRSFTLYDNRHGGNLSS